MGIARLTIMPPATSGSGTAGLSRSRRGSRAPSSTAAIAVWVAREPGSAEPGLGELLGDGTAPAASCLWRRQLVLGPAPEFCLLAAEIPAGVAQSRLPGGWSARTVAREAISHEQ